MHGQTSSLEAHDAGLYIGGEDAPRVLVIEDDDLHRMIVWRAAAKAGFSPEGAATFEEAARLAREQVFDCITLDLSVGEHNGVEMLHHLCKLGCKAPIIIISGCDDATCRETMRIARSLDLNVCEPVPKPVDLAMLRYALDRLRALHVLSFAEASMTA